MFLHLYYSAYLIIHCGEIANVGVLLNYIDMN